MNITISDLLKLNYIKTINLDAISKKNITGVSIDSRTIKPGEIFFAIEGRNFDGVQFVGKAFEQGAVCAVVSRMPHQKIFTGKTVIIVKDTVRALGELAKIYRTKFKIPIIAIGGSNGKTTTKEMLISILNTRYSPLKTLGNQNNHIGVPLTLFRLNKKYDIGVIELGTNHFGEVGYLCDIARPTHGLITNIGREHLESFENINGVARAEGELFDALETNGVGFVNADDKYILKKSRRLSEKTTFGLRNGDTDVRGKFLGFDSKGCAKFTVKPKHGKTFSVQLSTPGMHAISNALAAATIGLSFSVKAGDIRSKLEQFVGTDKRLEVIKTGKVTILNDTYNANPDSVLAALKALALMNCRGSKIVVLADMLELGTGAKLEHKKIGAAVSSIGINQLFTFGPMAKFVNEKANLKVKAHFDNKQLLLKHLINNISSHDIILIKGSRAMKMEEVVVFLQEHLN